MSNPKDPNRLAGFAEFDETMIAPTDDPRHPPPPHKPVASDPFVQAKAPMPQMAPPPGNDETRVMSTESMMQVKSAPPGMASMPQNHPPAAGNVDVASETTILHEQLTDLPPLGKLVVLDGVEKGQEYSLLETTVRFGRERDNTISFPDLAVSRHHFKIHQRNGGYVLEDLGSGNGTAVNGKRYKKQELQLKHGDRIQVGKSLLQFQVVGETLAAPKPSGSSSGVVVFLLVFLILLVGGGLAVFFMYPMTDDAAANRQRANELLEEGIGLYKQRRWSQSKRLFQKVLQLDKGNLEAKQHWNEANQEERTEKWLEEAKKLHEQKKLKEALQVVRKANDNLAAGSVYADQIWKLQSQLNQAIAAQTPAAPTPAVVAVKTKASTQTKAPIERRATPQPRTEPIMDKRRRRRRRRRRGRNRTRPEPTSPSPAPVIRKRVVTSTTPRRQKSGADYFRSGSASLAKAAFQRAGKSGKAQKVSKFEGEFRRGRAAHNNRNPVAAIGALQNALQLDMELSGGRRSVYSRQIRLMLANMYASRGMLAMSRNSTSAAYRFFRAALRYQRNHGISRAKIKEFKRRANRLYKQGKSLLNSNPRQGKQILRKAAGMIPRSDPLFRQIQHLLN